MKEVYIYTDGACRGNPGPGGWGAVLVYNENRRELSGGFLKTTNNRMEIMGCIAGLKALKEPCSVIVYSDSKYVVNAIALGWAENWRRKRWMRTPNSRAKNADLWQELLQECARHKVDFRWVRGHAGHKENERCDALAVQAAAGRNLPEDTGFFHEQQPQFNMQAS